MQKKTFIKATLSYELQKVKSLFLSYTYILFKIYPDYLNLLMSSIQQSPKINIDNKTLLVLILWKNKNKLKGNLAYKKCLMKILLNNKTIHNNTYNF